MEKRKYERAGREIRLAGLCLCLLFVAIEGFAVMGVYESIEPYWVRVSVIEAAMLVPTLIFLCLGPKQYILMLRVKPVKIRVVLLAFVVEICISPLLGLCNLITQLFTPNVVETALEPVMGETPYAMMVVGMVICPAVFEELYSRGIMLSAFKTSGRRLAAILFTALCFALPHGNLNQFAYGFVAGLFMCVVVEATDSVLTSMAMHFVTNFISVTTMYYLHYIEVAARQTNELMGLPEDSGSKFAEIIETEAFAPVLITMEVITFVLVAALAFLGLLAAYRLIGYMSVLSGRYDYIKKVIPQGGIFRLRSKYDQMREEKEKGVSGGLDGYHGIGVSGEFRKNPGSGAETIPGDVLSEMPKTKIMNPLLIVGIVLWAGFAVLYELVIHGVFTVG